MASERSPGTSALRDEAHTIARVAAELRRSGKPFVVATVVKVTGSSYRRPGARLLATEEERVAGSVSGGCLERDLVRTGFWRTRSGPVVVQYDSSDPDDLDGALGCGGVVDVLLERGDASFHVVEETILANQRRAIVTVFSERALGTRFVWGPGAPVPADVASALAADVKEALTTGRATPRRYGDLEALIEPVVPPPSLLVFGAGLDALPIVESACRLGWQVTVLDALARPESQARFRGARVVDDLARMQEAVALADQPYAIVMAHDRRRDRESIAMLLGSAALYIGVLGPRHRSEGIAEELGVDLFADPRVHAPVGLDLGAETAEEIALSVVAEILSCIRRASTQSLRSRRFIHGAP